MSCRGHIKKIEDMRFGGFVGASEFGNTTMTNFGL